MPMAQIRSEEFIGRTTAVHPGKKCCSRTTMSARLIWRSIRKTHGQSIRRFGIRDGHRGAFIRRLTGRGAEYLNRPTVATTGNNLPADFRRNEWAGLELLLLRQIQSCFTQL